MKTRDEYRRVTAEALTDWRLGCIPSRPDSSFERAVVIAGLAEILRLRLETAYMPLLQGLQRIENRIDILANIRENPYAPPPERPGQDKISTIGDYDRHGSVDHSVAFEVKKILDPESALSRQAPHSSSETKS